jgi:hypothetical protein
MSFFYYIYVLSDRHQKNARRNFSIFFFFFFKESRLGGKEIGGFGLWCDMIWANFLMVGW